MQQVCVTEYTADLEIYLVIPLATQCATERKDGQDRKKTDVKMEEKKGLNKGPKSKS